MHQKKILRRWYRRLNSKHIKNYIHKLETKGRQEDIYKISRQREKNWRLKLGSMHQNWKSKSFGEGRWDQGKIKMLFG